MVHRIVSSNSLMRYALVDSCRAPMAILWNLVSVLMLWPISQTSVWKGSLQMRSLVIFWYQQISKGHCAQSLVMWSLDALCTGSVLTAMQGWCLSSKDLAWAQQPLLLHFPCFNQLSQDFSSLLFCLLELLYLSQESVWRVLLVEPLLSPLHSFLLLELLLVPLLCAEKHGFLLAGWILGVTLSLLCPSGEKVLQHCLRGHSWHARSCKDSWLLPLQSGLWGRDHWLRDVWCPLFLHSQEFLLQGLPVPFELL